MVNESIYLQGSHHQICQDYALSSEDGNEVTVCDGCSGAKMSDVGARVLAHHWQKYHSIDFSNWMKTICEDLGLPHSSMFATLNTIRIFKDKTISDFMLGDGFTFFKKKDILHILKSEYEANAPYYPAYSTKPLLDKWKTDFPNNKLIFTSYEFDNALNLKDVKDEYTPLPYNLSEVEYIGVATDGLGSFDCDFEEVVKEIFGFKNYNPGFLIRRVLAAKRMFEKRGVSHHDDLSIGVIVNV